MSQLSAFLEPIKSNEIIEVIPSKRFQDKDGKPAVWKIKPISQSENEVLTKRYTERKFKNGRYQETFNNNEYQKALIEATVVEPDLHDQKLCERWGTYSAGEIPSKMLYPGEYLTLINAITDACGFDDEVSDEENVKN